MVIFFLGNLPRADLKVYAVLQKNAVSARLAGFTPPGNTPKTTSRDDRP